MNNTVSKILYGGFFAAAAVVIVLCGILLVEGSTNRGTVYEKLEAVVISGGREATSNSYNQMESVVPVPDKAHTQKVSMTVGYDKLDTDEKRYLYEKINESIYSLTNEKDENGHYRTERVQVSDSKMSEFDIREAVSAYMSDNPEVFWIENLFGYAYSDNNTIVEFYSVLSSDECEVYIDKFQSKLKEILDEVQGSTVYELEKSVHDRILGNCVYKDGVTSSNDGWEYFTAYGALVNGEAVCEGYAKSLQVLLNLKGIECYTIRGTADNIGHLWNIVKLEGEWYHIDPTWDDNKDGTISYEYFNVSTKKIEKNHIISSDVNTVITQVSENSETGTDTKYNFLVPNCISDKMNYYTVEGLYVEDYDEKTEQQIVQKIVMNVNKGDILLPVRFGKRMTYDEYLRVLFYDTPYRFYSYIDKANQQLDQKHQISKDTISIIKNPDDMTLRIKFHIVA